MKIAFYIDNSRNSKVDCRDILNGNPGMGGTEYLFYSTTYALQRLNKDDRVVKMLTLTDAILPEDMDTEVVGSKQGAVEYCKEHGYDILVVKFEQKDYDSDELFSSSNVGNVKIVVWAHNVIPNHILNRMSRLGGISAIVNVGREQLDLYRDHPMFYKSTYIYNSVPVKELEFYRSLTPFDKRKNEVTYLGSLIHVKGFHVLAKAWKEVVKEIPDAHLNVIGSGTLYGNSKLGFYGIAEESYETEFMPYLTDENGKILDSVTFWGKLGKEKDEVLAKTKVGVPNPAGTSETFCLSAVEMALMGARIVSKKYVGLIDTVSTEIGTLVKKEKNLAAAIVAELRSDNYELEKAYKFINDNFTIGKVVESWLVLFDDVISGKPVNKLDPMKNKSYNLKWLREINRKVKKFIPRGAKLLTVDYIINSSLRFFRVKTNRIIVKF